MRKIKFRGKHGSVWHHGSLITQDTDRPQILNDYGDVYDVAPETVGQYTGREDRHGVPIYEGDILTDNVSYNLFYEVYFNEKSLSFCMRGIRENGLLSAYRLAYLYEVVGNIHDSQKTIKEWNRKVTS